MVFENKQGSGIRSNEVEPDSSLQIPKTRRRVQFDAPVTAARPRWIFTTLPIFNPPHG